MFVFVIDCELMQLADNISEMYKYEIKNRKEECMRVALESVLS